jgi:hypothetical protein
MRLLVLQHTPIYIVNFQRSFERDDWLVRLLVTGKEPRGQERRGQHRTGEDRGGEDRRGRRMGGLS